MNSPELEEILATHPEFIRGPLKLNMDALPRALREAPCASAPCSPAQGADLFPARLCSLQSPEMGCAHLAESVTNHTGALGGFIRGGGLMALQEGVCR